MRQFLHRHLDPVDRLGEILFGLIMALGITGAVRLGRAEADNHELFVDIFGCNLAWGVVDGVMFVLTSMFERGRKARLVRQVLAAPTDELALRAIGTELQGTVISLANPDEHRQLCSTMLEIIRRTRPERAGLHREDLLGGLAVALVIVLCTLPIVVPFVLMASPEHAVRTSNSIALAQLFVLGAWWGRVVDGRWFRVAAGLTLIGVVLVLITIALGG